MPDRKKKYRTKGSGSIVKRGKTYYLQYMVNGKLKRISLKCTSEKEAKKKAKETLLPLQTADTKEKIAFQLAEARNLISSQKIQLEDVWDNYIQNPQRPDSGKNTLLFYKRNWNRFKNWLKETNPSIKNMSQITEREAKLYSEYLWNLKISAKTYNEHIRTLTLITRVLSNSGFNVWQTITRKTEDKQSRKEFTEDEVIKILDSFDDSELKLLNKEEMRVLFHLGAWTGLRLIDCALMKWENINFSRNIITCRPIKTSRKTNRIVTIPIHPLLNIALNNANNWKKDEYVIPNVAERYQSDSYRLKKEISSVFQHIGLIISEKREGIQRRQKVNVYGFHSFRHSFVSFCAKAGVPMPVVQSIVGHGNPAITRHYIHIGEESVRQAINALPQGKEEKRTSDQKIEEVIGFLNQQKKLTQREKKILKILG